VNSKLSLKEKLGSVLRRKKAFDDSEEDDKKLPDKNDKKADSAPAAQPKTPVTPAKLPDSETVKIEKEIANLQDGLGRIESSITKAMTASTTGFEENIKGLMQKLDDVVISMQSAQSDKNSPFNSTSLIQELPETVGLHPEEQKQAQQEQQQSGPKTSEKSSDTVERTSKSAAHEVVEGSTSIGHSNSLMDSIADVLQQQNTEENHAMNEDEPSRESVHNGFSRRLPQVSNRLQEFVKSCALLEIVEGDHKRLNYLYDIGVLRTEDLETASRIVDLLGRYSPNLKPVDLAIIACSIEETAASDRETRKLLAIATALNKSR
jgi:hypothetical protein